MPHLGELKRGKELGYKNRYLQLIWHACEKCKQERWVAFCKGQPVSKLCPRCGKLGLHPSEETKTKIREALKGERCYRWKGGRRKTGRGYIRIQLQPDDFFYPMVTCDGYVLEHRLVVAKALGRCLHLWEIVHHKNGCPKDDNRYPETLQLVSDDRHKQISILERKINRQREQIIKLKLENRLLKRRIIK